MGSNNKFGWLQTPATTPQGKSLYPDLSQYAANRAQTVQREPNAVLSFQQFTSEPARNHPFAKPFWGLKPPTGVRIPPSPPEFSHHIVNRGVPSSFTAPVTEAVTIFAV